MSEIKPLREKITELEAAGKERDKKLDRIIMLLNNDEGTGQHGLVATVRDNATELLDVKKKFQTTLSNTKSTMPTKKAETWFGGLLVALFGQSFWQ